MKVEKKFVIGGSPVDFMTEFAGIRVYETEDSDAGSKTLYFAQDDERYPTLVIQGDGYSVGYDLDKDTGELERVCICPAWYEHECVCGGIK